jgi:hypothetical protein
VNLTRAKQLANAMKELEGSLCHTLGEALQRVLRLIELCPWLDEPCKPAPAKKPKEKTK